MAASGGLPRAFFQYGDVERIELYRPGGYHPVAIGDRLHGRYRIIHKLGHGSYSTAWLARDEDLNRSVAVKIFVADSRPREAEILSHLQGSETTTKDDPGRSCVLPFLDTFDVEGPNGTHACLVTPLASCSLSETMEGSLVRLFELQVVRAVAAQVAMALAYIHARGVVHGDVRVDNILLKTPPAFDKLPVEELYRRWGAPKPEPVVRLDKGPLPHGVPSHAVPAIWLGTPSETLSLVDATVFLSGFGEAFVPSREDRHRSRMPYAIRPPEVRFEPTKPLSYPADIWSFACLIWALLGRRQLFEGLLPTEDDVTSEQVEALGPLPSEWWTRWEARDKWYTSSGQPTSNWPAWSWDARFEYGVQKPREEEGLTVLDAEERDALFAMLRPMLSFRPEDRPSAAQVLESEWMTRWAMPDFETTSAIGASRSF